LPESKNTSEIQKIKRRYGAHELGEQSEEAVEKYFQSLGFQVWGRRLRTPYAEVDLVFCRIKEESIKENQLYLVEVKSLGEQDFSLARVSRKQKGRLLRARLYFESRFECEVGLAFAYVLRSGQIILFNEGGELLTL
jgi:Holliday junction resolvase-like predicted endonuclease